MPKNKKTDRILQPRPSSSYREAELLRLVCRLENALPDNKTIAKGCVRKPFVSQGRISRDL